MCYTSLARQLPDLDINPVRSLSAQIKPLQTSREPPNRLSSQGPRIPQLLEASTVAAATRSASAGVSWVFRVAVDNGVDGVLRHPIGGGEGPDAGRIGTFKCVRNEASEVSS